MKGQAGSTNVTSWHADLTIMGAGSAYILRLTKHGGNRSQGSLALPEEATADILQEVVEIAPAPVRAVAVDIGGP